MGLSYMGPEREFSHQGGRNNSTKPEHRGADRERETERGRGMGSNRAVYMMDEKEERKKTGGKCGEKDKNVKERMKERKRR